jgi:hydrogenase expression/formation protein HypC
MCLTIPGRIISIDHTDPEAAVAQVDFGVAVKSASLLYTPEARVGDFVLVQAGFATGIVPEADALESLEYARQLEEYVDAGPLSTNARSPGTIPERP